MTGIVNCPSYASVMSLDTKIDRKCGEHLLLDCPQREPKDLAVFNYSEIASIFVSQDIVKFIAIDSSKWMHCPKM